MLNLNLIRHADAEFISSSQRDFDRCLTKKGIQHATQSGRELYHQGISPVTILSSPANRARQTAEIIAGQLNHASQNIRYPKIIYDASLNQLIKLINGLDNQLQSVLLVGHNPGLSNLCRYILGQSHSLATAEVASIYFELDDWLAVCENTGSLRLSIDPRSK
ncbi:MAG: histidine phosphatase family protein [Gammaproteobacteria bacterium]